MSRTGVGRRWTVRGLWHLPARMLSWMLLVSMGLLSGCAWTASPAHGIEVGNGPEGEDWTIGGRAQRVWIRGHDPRAPLLLVLHGGPGVSATGLFRHFVPDLERHFTVAYWDQRGTGRSYRHDLPASELTLDRLTADTAEVIEQLRARYPSRPLHLMGVSWGGLLALSHAHRSVRQIASLILVSPLVRPLESEAESWRWTLEQARRQGRSRAVEALESMGPPPHSVDDMLALRGWTDEMGGAFRGPLDQGDLILGALKAPEVGWWDLVRFGAGNRLSLQALWPVVARHQAPERLAGAVPVLFVLGRHDWQVPSTVGARHARALDVPCKRVVWFEQSGHHPAFEEPGRFVALLRAWAADGGVPCPQAPR